MRRRIIVVALATCALAVALFALPLAVVLQRLYLASAQDALQRTALQAAVAIDPQFVVGDPAELPIPPAGQQIGLYAPTGQRVSGSGPTIADAPTRVALAGQVGEGQVDGWVVVSVPLSSAEKVVGAVRSAEPVATSRDRTIHAWLLMSVAAVAAIALAAIAAAVLARRVTRPIDALATSVRQLGDGDFTVRSTPTGLPELDRAGRSLDATAERIADLVQREQQIAANASHQLRTPLTGLRATLEAALADPSIDITAAARQAIRSADALDVTISELLRLTRGVAATDEVVDIAPLLDDVVSQWSGGLAVAGRLLRLVVPADLERVTCSRAGLNQILHVLMENAVKHGHGAVTIEARALDGAVAIDVGDEATITESEADIFARGVSATGTGIGLAMARGLAEDMAARLWLSHRDPTRFTLILQATAE